MSILIYALAEHYKKLTTSYGNYCKYVQTHKQREEILPFVSVWKVWKFVEYWDIERDIALYETAVYKVIYKFTFVQEFDISNSTKRNRVTSKKIEKKKLSVFTKTTRVLLYSNIECCVGICLDYISFQITCSIFLFPHFVHSTQYRTKQ